MAALGSAGLCVVAVLGPPAWWAPAPRSGWLGGAGSLRQPGGGACRALPSSFFPPGTAAALGPALMHASSYPARPGCRRRRRPSPRAPRLLHAALCAAHAWPACMHVHRFFPPCPPGVAHYILQRVQVEQRGVEVNQRDSGRGWTPLMRCARMAHYKNAPYLQARPLGCWLAGWLAGGVFACWERGLVGWCARAGNGGKAAVQHVPQGRTHLPGGCRLLVRAALIMYRKNSCAVVVCGCWEAGAGRAPVRQAAPAARAPAALEPTRPSPRPRLPTVPSPPPPAPPPPPPCPPQLFEYLLQQGADPSLQSDPAPPPAADMYNPYETVAAAISGEEPHGPLSFLDVAAEKGWVGAAWTGSAWSWLLGGGGRGGGLGVPATAGWAARPAPLLPAPAAAGAACCQAGCTVSCQPAHVAAWATAASKLCFETAAGGDVQVPVGARGGTC